MKIVKNSCWWILPLWMQDSFAVDQRFVYEAELDLEHVIGSYSQDGWAATTAYDEEGFLSFGPYARDWGEGGGRAIFRMKIDNVDADNLDIVHVEIYDPAYKEVVASRFISRREFEHPFKYQDFDLWFSTEGRHDHSLEARVYWYDRAFIKLDKITVEMDYHQQGLPNIVNQSESSDEHVEGLVQKAIDGLGFNPEKYDAPNQRDLMFVGQYYIAWIDQTGFYGKMNALWVLNGEQNQELDFVHKDNRRPVSFLGVAENGDGQWLKGYQGAEHFEIPHTQAEYNDDADCEGYLCNWYGVNEADRVSDPDVPHWTVCGDNSLAWTKNIEPIEQEDHIYSYKIVYEAPITKEGDGDGRNDGDFCHHNYLFSDGVRRPVYLKVGYELHGDKNYFDRTYQIRNPEGNPEFGSKAWSVIGGLVITQYTNSHPLKGDIFNHIQPENFDIRHNRKWFPAQESTLYDRQVDDSRKMNKGKDDVWAWLGQPVSWSREGKFSLGDSLRLSHEGVMDNGDVGFCFCNTHNGIEIGGGVLHQKPSLFLPGGTESPVAVRRITFPNSEPRSPFPITYEAEADLLHGFGQGDGEGWSATTAGNDSGHLIYGPYSTQWGDGKRTARFRMMLDNVTAGGTVAVIDIYDYTTDEVIALRRVRRSEFNEPFEYQDITLSFDLKGREGHLMEARLWWTDVSYLNVDYVQILENE